jgi:hypothetical protein
MTVANTQPCTHQHAVTPPRGSMDQPGDCRCGITYDQARAESFPESVTTEDAA